VITGVLYFLLKEEGSLAMGVLIVFLVMSIPMILINIGRCFNNKIKKIFYLIAILYTFLFIVFSIINLDMEDWLIFIFIGLLLICILAIELVKSRKYLILNYLSIVYLLSFLLYCFL